ncbi:MAG: Eco57I restriction-modification methylase domain-containing protein [Kiritimatiellia bacterium]
MKIGQIESRRQERQTELDAGKSIADRRQMGQFATPNGLAKAIAAETLRYLPANKNSLQILEPSMGTGSFVSAAFAVFSDKIARVCGYEFDEAFYKAAGEIWREYPVTATHADFTRATPEKIFDVVLANPPYVRHHMLQRAEKKRLQALVASTMQIDISGLAGLYCHFMLLSVAWMKRGAIGAWLVPAEWMTVNYGLALRRFLTERVQLLRIHCFDSEDVRFSDALVSSCVIWFANQSPDDRKIEFTFGPDLHVATISRLFLREELTESAKWPPRRDLNAADGGDDWRIGDFFDIRRGIVTGDNRFFVMSEADARKRRIPDVFLRPILPSPHSVNVNHVQADDSGLPVNVERRYLLDCTGHKKDALPESVRMYLESGEQTTAQKNLCLSRTVWYNQEQRRPTPFLCSYMGRGTESNAPVRFVLNDSRAIASNSFLMMYPKLELAKVLAADAARTAAVWKLLTGIPRERIMAAGRSYGGGLQKVEPKELASILCPEIGEWIVSCGGELERDKKSKRQLQFGFVGGGNP